MAVYTGQQQFLLRAANQYHSLGYKVGFCKGKAYLGQYEPPDMSWFGAYQKETPEGFDGISLIPEGMVCVDIDINDFSVIWEPLPPTLKERTPRGWHLFYRIHDDMRFSAQPKIKWRPHVDLLVKPGVNPQVIKKRSRYHDPDNDDDSKDSPWGEHVLISPTTGYSRIWPDQIPTYDSLPVAPRWLLDVLEK